VTPLPDQKRTTEREEKDMNKNGFFAMKPSSALGLIGFIAVSLLAHLPAIRNTMAAGLNCCSWILLILALALPVYCIIVETAELKKE